MGMFSGVGTFFKEKKAEREAEKAKEYEYQQVLKSERHKARLEAAPKIARIEIAEDIKAARSGKPKKGGGGILGGIQDYANNFGSTGYMQGMTGGGGGFEMPAMDFGFGAPPKARRTAKKSHKKSKRR